MAKYDEKLNAWDDLQKHLEDEENVEAIVFGPWGWDGYGEPERKPVPKEKQGKVLLAIDAKPMMLGWSFNGDYGAPDCYAVYIWTNKHVIWVSEYDGSTWLSSAPRNPIACIPDTSGG